jgi:CRISPR/Cas system-associated endonuclease Cas3-HD
MCLISPYGSFNYKEGGHLVLDELKLILELSPGCIAFIPSALFTHHNIPIAPGEKRQAFTAYTPARMFQWVENGFKCVGKQENIPKKIKKAKGNAVFMAAKKRLPHIFEKM